MLAATLLYVLSFAACFSLTDSIECYMRNQYQSRDAHRSYACTSTTGASSQCFKFVCTGTSSSSNPFYIQKGCLDSSNAGASTCQNLISLCQGLGGGATGTCFTCSNNRCNGAESARFSKMLLVIPVIATYLMTHKSS